MNPITTLYLSLSVTAVLSAAAPAQQSVDLKPETLTSDDGATFEAEFGRIRVPENRTDPESREIRVAFLRVKSPHESPGPPVFVLAGGPGGSSIRTVRGMVKGGGTEVMDILRGDVIGIDQRGIGKSRPGLNQPVRFGLPVAQPGDPAQLLSVAKLRCREAAQHWHDEGFDLNGYTTVESADDIDAVRRALGYDTMVLWGGSYGSHLALATLRRHASHIERVAAFGPEGPDHTIKLPSYAHDGLQRISDLVAEDPALAAQLPDMMKTVEELLARLAKEPVYVEGFDPTQGKRVPIGIGEFDVQVLMAQAIGRVRTMRMVPAWVHAMAQGDFKETARLVIQFRMGAGVRSPMAAMMDSASGVSAERSARIAQQAKTCVLGDAVNFPYPGIGEAWGFPDLGAEFRGPLQSDVPVLFVVGDLDSRTPVCNAEELMQHLPNAHLIVVENAGHDLRITSMPELKKAVRHFLRGEPVQLTRLSAPRPKFDPLPPAGKAK